MFDPIGVCRLMRVSLYIARNLKQKNNNIYVFATNRSYTKEETHASSTTIRNMTFYDSFICDDVNFVTK
jgi:hypothetical protein